MINVNNLVGNKQSKMWKVWITIRLSGDWRIVSGSLINIHKFVSYQQHHRRIILWKAQGCMTRVSTQRIIWIILYLINWHTEINCRVTDGKFILNGEEFCLAQNSGRNAVHGGIEVIKIACKYIAAREVLCFIAKHFFLSSGFWQEALARDNYFWQFGLLHLLITWQRRGLSWRRHCHRFVYFDRGQRHWDQI